MSLASVVAIVFPASYEACSPDTALEHLITLFDASIHRPAPVVVARPVIFKNESESVLTVTLFVPFGEKVDWPLAVKVCPVATVAPALAVISPVAVKALLTVVVPVEAPMLTAVASPPMFTVVAFVLNRVAIPVEVVVISAPLTAKSAAAVTFPVKVDVPSTVNVPLAWMFPVLLIETPVEP